jgi:putative molybdopterin biosynthesis protein
MDKVAIKPAWQFVGANGERVDPRLFSLLRAIHYAGKLTVAAAQIKLSYRHAWDLLSKWSEFFGSPLVVMKRGKGAYLSPLGEKLVWAEQRSDASLFPQLENIASRLNIEINRHFKPSERVIRLHASHGYAVEKLPVLMRAQGHADIDLQYMGSVDALRSLADGGCDIAGFHVPLDPMGSTLWEHYSPWIKPRQQRVIKLVTRTQGLIVARGNPLGIASLADLAKPGVRFVNRQKGSGTRIILDGMLKALSINPRKIAGYDSGEFTHAAVAACVASGVADVGVGVEPAARQFKLDFLSLVKERYMLACMIPTLQDPSVQELVKLLKGEEFAALTRDEPGYALDSPGEVVSMREAFPWLGQ